MGKYFSVTLACLILLLAGSLTACGQKGALFLPESVKSEQIMQEQLSKQEAKQKENQDDKQNKKTGLAE